MIWKEGFDMDPKNHLPVQAQQAIPRMREQTVSFDSRFERKELDLLGSWARNPFATVL